MMRLLLLSTLLLTGLTMGWPAQAQNTISGIARDSLTQEPLGFASVFLANTTYGTTTDEQGHFALANVPAGQYDFVVSYLGYGLYKRTITVQRSLLINPLLAPASTQLREVIVQARRHRNDPTQYRRFVELFLGTSSFSRQCKIVNPQSVVVRYDAQQDRLTAVSADFIAVENRALGYLIKYYGLQFEADFKLQTVTFFGQPVFSELSDPKSQQRWQQNRKKAYYGSQSHFLRAIYDNQVTAQGYLVQRTKQVYNPQRALADTLLQQERAKAAPGTPYFPSDSLLRKLSEPRFYRYLYTKALPIDSLRQVKADGTRWLHFRDQLQVTYRNEPPDPRFHPALLADGSIPPTPTEQVSLLYLLRPKMQLLPNGQLAEPLTTFSEGYWSFERMGEFLPLDYSPYPPLPSGQKP